MSANQTLLRLSARGEALIAELLRLSDHTPTLFLLADKAEQKLYQDVLLDFRYLKSPELYEHRIEASAELVERDEDVWLTHGPLIDRFFGLFESIYKYIKDFVKVVNDIRDGVYLQQTVEGVLLDDEGKQLMCEVLYLYGVLLLLLDSRIDGAVRERIVVAYYRHKGQSAIESIEDMELLVRRTGYSTSVLDRSGMVRRPPGYPEQYLNRLVRKLGLPPGLAEPFAMHLKAAGDAELGWVFGVHRGRMDEAAEWLGRMAENEEDAAKSKRVQGLARLAKVAAGTGAPLSLQLDGLAEGAHSDCDHARGALRAAMPAL